jgi:hypothetical protein
VEEQAAGPLPPVQGAERASSVSAPACLFAARRSAPPCLCTSAKLPHLVRPRYPHAQRRQRSDSLHPKPQLRPAIATHGELPGLTPGLVQLRSPAAARSSRSRMCHRGRHQLVLPCAPVDPVRHGDGHALASAPTSGSRGTPVSSRSPRCRGRSKGVGLQETPCLDRFQRCGRLAVS